VDRLTRKAGDGIDRLLRDAGLRKERREEERQNGEQRTDRSHIRLRWICQYQQPRRSLETGIQNRIVDCKVNPSAGWRALFSPGVESVKAGSK
jgi:hypothetical protein